ncbi:MAG: class II fumarate hydratase [Tissierellia bacterium]|nr:class II fumarate hydratase [Tissierellia bacterium]
MDYRIEHDSMGEIAVPADKYWGSQTERSFENFPIGYEKMPKEIIEAFAYVKKAAAMANYELGTLDDKKLEAITLSTDAILEGVLDDNFPLVVWQTGSGTQSNMNMNEVIANYANFTNDEKILHPNDDVNKSQSSNDTFPTAMNVAAYKILMENTIPALKEFILELERKENNFLKIVKTGRTHLQDAVPLTLGQEIGGWKHTLENNLKRLECAIDDLRYLALGGTAVGTGLNAPEGFSETVAKKMSELTGFEFETSENKFTSLSFKSEFSYVHGAMASLASDLMKIANDIRWLASGPRCGIGELIIPANEPGSSIMPGKVNPTQAEALTMVCVQVMGNETAINIAASQGNFQLNVFMPLIAYNFLQSAKLLGDAMNSFRERCLSGLEPNYEVIDYNMKRSLMLVTSLNPYIGYDKAAEVAKLAHKEDISLKEAVLKLGYLTKEEFDKIVVPEKLV